MFAAFSCLSICHELLVLEDLGLTTEALLQDSIVDRRGAISLGFGKARHFELACKLIGRHEERIAKNE